MNVKNYVRTLVCLYLTILLPICNVHAQALKVGDAIPPELWNMPFQMVNHPDGKEIISLEEYKDKLIILDFWATWCAPCIKSLNKLDSLQKEFGDRLAIVPLTDENGEKVVPVLNKRGWSLPSILSDTLLKGFFPYRSLPHQVWLKAGRVLAVTGPEYATRDCISKVLENQYVNMKMKEEDMSFNPSTKPVIKGDAAFYSSSFSGKVNVNSAGVYRRKNGITIYNVHLNTLIREAFSNEIPFYARKNRVILDSLLLKDPNPKISDSLYSYYLDLPDSAVNTEIYRIFRSDLLNFLKIGFNITAFIERRKQKCLILDVADKKLAISESGDFLYKNTGEQIILTNCTGNRLSEILGNLNWKNSIPIINELPEGIHLNIVLSGNLTDLKYLRNELKKHGLSLLESEAEIDVLIITRSNGLQ